MTTCPQRDHLMDEWNDAVAKFSTSIRRLKAAIGDGRYADEHRATELARQRAENARTMLELHRAEHGC